MATYQWTGLALLAITAPLCARTATDRPREASIAFANHGGIHDFEADGETAIFLQDRQMKWYRATFRAPCIDLPFALSIGYQVDGTDTFDHFSSILVNGRRCPVDTLTVSETPPKHDKHKKG